ncbi:hypothetical protein BESB_061730 [Besnoitia besnoiti]|uniref:Transmembrane protein n=1 Tax=Besnoitia besnoiti TaxID=94643 RepID=A0A2A9MH47_BESBE|nr:hypothetical protein BESB_061730 [Besnoitia besnoiti]PFH35286.1 hypothetical protein BESB_061730 [Besnoitia besnoiti]
MEAQASPRFILLGRILRPLVVSLFLLSYLFFFHGILYPIVDIKAGSFAIPGSGIVDQRMTMPETLQNLWADREILPVALIFTFSLFVPCLKLLLFCLAVVFAPPSLQKEAGEPAEAEKVSTVAGHPRDCEEELDAGGDEEVLRRRRRLRAASAAATGDTRRLWGGEREARATQATQDGVHTTASPPRCAAPSRACSRGVESEGLSRASSCADMSLGCPPEDAFFSLRPTSFSSQSEAERRGEAEARERRGWCLGGGD